jgi:ABC-type branched-subunit amino acid transport system ATPase component
MLRLEGVRAGYSRHPVLLGVDLQLADGERLAVLGRNGVGKTTLMRTIVGLLPVTDGRLTLDGVDLGRRPTHELVALGIGYVPQGRQVFTGLSVLDNLRVAAVACHGRAWQEPLRRVLDDFPLLRERCHTKAENLSGGQQQLLVLARSLLTEPRILLLDEPTDGIQPSILDELAASLTAVSEHRGLAVLLAEQNLEFVTRLAERAVVIEKGRVSAEVTTAELDASRELQRRYLAV